jgi:hypothetical protein
LFVGAAAAAAAAESRERFVSDAHVQPAADTRARHREREERGGRGNDC